MTQPDPTTPTPAPPPRPLIGVVNGSLIISLFLLVVDVLFSTLIARDVFGVPAWPPTLPTYLLIAVFLGGEIAACVAILRWWRRRRERREREKDPEDGLAKPDALDERLGAEAVIRTAPRLRPSLAHKEVITASEAGAQFARQKVTGSGLFATHEDSKICIAPVRMGKTGRQAVPDIVRAPGAVVATSTRFDLLELTAMERRKRGTIFVFDPEGRTPWPAKLRWSFIRGCENYDTAMRRAIAICSARPLGDMKNAGYFGGQAEGVLAALLHAAAISDSGVEELRQWTVSASRRPAAILDTHPDAAAGTADHLTRVLDSLSSANDTSGSGGIYTTLELLLRPLASPATREACSPGDGDEQLDIRWFIRRGCDSLYLISRGRKGSAAPIVNALMSEILHESDIISQSPTREQLSRPAEGDLRLDPPLRIVMDEAAGVTPIEDLAQRMADSGGRGVQLYVFVQSFSQLRQRWGLEQATEIWDCASVKLILGGLSNARDLEEISRLLRERGVSQVSVSTGADRSQVTSSQRWLRALTPDQIRTLPDGEGLMLYRNLDGAKVDLPGWWEQDDLKDVVRASRIQSRQMVLDAGMFLPDEPLDDDPVEPDPVLVSSGASDE
ncbi:MAG TPA: TraM recognition domain-containing protein [Pseudonocardiaceae bacterium]|jgi:type IV secretory pathway TraG/TraD family ATPase VirD4